MKTFVQKKNFHISISQSQIKLKFGFLLFFGLFLSNVNVFGSEISSNSLYNYSNFEEIDLQCSNSDHDIPSPFNKPIDSDTNESESSDEKEPNETSDSDNLDQSPNKIIPNYNVLYGTACQIKDYNLILLHRKIIPLFVLQHSWRSFHV